VEGADLLKSIPGTEENHGNAVGCVAYESADEFVEEFHNEPFSLNVSPSLNASNKAWYKSALRQSALGK